jgi:hypothetical protein
MLEQNCRLLRVMVGGWLRAVVKGGIAGVAAFFLADYRLRPEIFAYLPLVGGCSYK